MPLLLPLSPNVAAQLTSLAAQPRPEASLAQATLQRALFQVSTFESMDQARNAMNAVAAAVAPYRTGLEQVVRGTTTYRKEMRYFGFLQNGNADGARLALAEIANHPRTLELLCQSPDTLEIVAKTAQDMTVDGQEIRRQHLDWIGAPLGSASTPLNAWGQICYWLSGISAPKNWAAWSSAASMAPEFAYWAATGQAPAGILAASSAVLAGALYGMAHRNAASKRLYEAAQKGPIGFDDVRAYFESFNQFLPRAPLAKTAANHQNVLEAIRKSSAPGGVPEASRLSTLQLASDFLSLGSVTVKGLKENPESREIYNRLAQVIGLGTLSNAHWQPTILNAHRLEQIAEYKRQGKKVIFVANHRSHLDILLAVALLPDFNVRFVAKDDLLKIPVLGDILRLAEHFTVDREHDDNRLDKVMAWGTGMLSKGMSPFFFIEGTRMDTPNRREEVGMRPPEIGAAKLASLFPEDAVIVPIVTAGLGSLLRKDEKKVLKEGMTIYQPTMTSILEPIEVASILDQNPGLSEREEIRLNSLVWNRMWHELARIQAYMNDLAVKAA